MSNISALAQSRGERREGEVVQSWVWAGTRRARMSQSPILTVTTATLNQSGERIGVILCGRAVLINSADWSTIWTYSVSNAAIYFWQSFCNSLWFDQIKNTGLVRRMPDRKWRESKQQLSCWPELALFGCILVSLHFLWCFLHTSTVVIF